MTQRAKRSSTAKNAKASRAEAKKEVRDPELVALGAELGALIARALRDGHVPSGWTRAEFNGTAVFLPPEHLSNGDD
jgi:hypothetical protein